MTGSVPPSPADPLLLGVDHVGLAVADLDQAVRFHTDVLGLVLLHREENDDQDIVEAMLGGGDATSGTQIQLLAPRSPHSVLATFLDRSRPGLHHIAYRVADVESAAQTFRRRGLRLLYDRGRPGTRGSRINFVHPKDAGGVLTELVQPR